MCNLNTVYISKTLDILTENDIVSKVIEFFSQSVFTLNRDFAREFFRSDNERLRCIVRKYDCSCGAFSAYMFRSVRQELCTFKRFGSNRSECNVDFKSKIHLDTNAAGEKQSVAQKAAYVFALKMCNYITDAELARVADFCGADAGGLREAAAALKQALGTGSEPSNEAVGAIFGLERRQVAALCWYVRKNQLFEKTLNIHLPPAL